MKRLFLILAILISTAPIAQGAGTMKVFYTKSKPHSLDDTHCSLDVFVAGGTPLNGYENTITIPVSASSSQQQIAQQIEAAIVSAWNDPNTGSGLGAITANDVVEV